MPFSPKLKEWYLRAYGDGDPEKACCQKVFYSEKRGFYRGCDQRENLYVVRWTLQEWGTIGIPFCRHHFMELTGTRPYGTQSSIYPELAWARRAYRTDKDSFLSLDPYSETHRTRVGDWGSDLYYFETGLEIITRYSLMHPEDKKPYNRPHRQPRWMEISEKYF